MWLGVVGVTATLAVKCWEVKRCSMDNNANNSCEVDTLPNGDASMGTGTAGTL